MLEITLVGNQLVFKGELTRDSVMAYWPLTLLSELPKSTEFDLMALQHVDTAGLAWLLHQLSQAKQLGIHVTLRNMPQQLTSLAEVSAVFDLLPVA